jgi:hypothetical protein
MSCGNAEVVEWAAVESAVGDLGSLDRTWIRHKLACGSAFVTLKRAVLVIGLVESEGWARLCVLSTHISGKERGIRTYNDTC